MHKTQDYFNPPMDGIWGTTELPALCDETDVKEVSGLSRPPSLNCLLSYNLTLRVTDDENQRRYQISYQVAVVEERASDRGQDRD